MSHQFVGTDKVAFLSTTKHGSQTLRVLSEPHNPKGIPDGYDFIESFREDITALDKHTILYPYRDNFECIKSGFIQDLTNMNWDVMDDGGPYFDQDKRQAVSVLRKLDLRELFQFIFDKRNASNPYVRWILLTIQQGYGHKHICFNVVDFFWNKIFLNDNWDGCKFYFFDLEQLSNPKLIEWISKIDDRWKDVSISHQNETSADPEKNELKEIFHEVGHTLGTDYLDYENVNNWKNFRNVNDFNKSLFNSIKKSKYFLDIINL